MSLIIPTLEEREEAKALRGEILDQVMNMHSLTSLRRMAIVGSRMAVDEAFKTPMDLSTFVQLLDLPSVVRLSDMFKDEPDSLIANAQVKELLKLEIEARTE